MGLSAFEMQVAVGVCAKILAGMWPAGVVLAIALVAIQIGEAIMRRSNRRPQGRNRKAKPLFWPWNS